MSGTIGGAGVVFYLLKQNSELTHAPHSYERKRTKR
jgi:hypothetical protein